MKSWLYVIGLVFLVSTLGCFGQATDAKGEPVADSVQFSRNGVAHCPYCGQVIKEHKKFTDGAASKRAKSPFVVTCSNKKCRQTFRWTQKFQACWYCDGGVVCRECKGTGTVPAPADPKKTMGCWRCGGAQGKKPYREGGRCPMCVYPVRRDSGDPWEVKPIERRGKAKGEVRGTDRLWSQNGFISHGQVPD